MIFKVVLTVLICLSTQQPDWSKLILGNWEGVSKTLLEDGEEVDYSIDGKGYSNDQILSFKSDGTVKVSDDQPASYSIDGNLLRMGNRQYTIEALNDTELLISIGDDYSRFLLKFKRIASKS